MSGIRNFSPLSLDQVKIDDKFWSSYQELVRKVVIPYQWEALNDRVEGAEPSHAVSNFKIAAGLEKGKFQGMVFQDSDLAKWIEAVAYSLQVHPDQKLEETADGLIEIIEKAQQPDGYLNTYYTLKEPENRWTNLHECHELYCAGHMLEAAVAYYEATGKERLLNVMRRFVDYISTVFGPEPEKLKGYPGHQELEIALLKLYRVTGEKKYLNLCRYFLTERGKKPYYFDIEWEKRGKTSHWNPNSHTRPGENAEYNQYHLPVTMQDTAVGHAVRAVYMYTAMADFAAETGDEAFLAACRKLWNNIVRRQMYITGGIGSTNLGEAFTFDYDLPNDINYAETCASIGLIFFASRMLQIEAKGEYADVIEKALYNTVISAMSRDGHSFFYVNPLEVWPEASEKNPTRFHVKPVRQPWFGCACCPPNLARLLSSLGRYVYTANQNSIYCHLYIGGSAEIALEGGKVVLSQQTDYPWSGKVKLTVSEGSGAFTLAMRRPGWCEKAGVSVNGAALADYELKDGYILLRREWKGGDTVELDFDMPVTVMEANPLVRADAGKVALTRGPLVYCFEEADNGANLSALSLKTGGEPKTEWDPQLCGGAVIIQAQGVRTDASGWDGSLYRPARRNEKPAALRAVPYFLWGNRGKGEMLTWIRSR